MVYWDIISEIHEFTDEFLIKFEDRIDWDIYVQCHYVSDFVLDSLHYRMDWNNVFCNQIVSRELINKYHHLATLDVLITCINLPRTIIEEATSEELNAYCRISKPPEFVVERILHKIDLEYLLKKYRYPKLSAERWKKTKQIQLAAFAQQSTN